MIAETKLWREHPINIRATFRRFFITLVAGINQRNPDRREEDRKVHPLKTMSNLLFMAAAVVAVYTISAAITLVLAVAILNI